MRNPPIRRGRASAALLTSVVTAGALTLAFAGAPANAEQTTDVLKSSTTGWTPTDQERLAEARAKGQKTVTVLVAARDGQVAAAADSLTQLGATVLYRDDDLGYLRAEVATERAERIARRMETGGVCVNNVLQSPLQLQAPFGGWKTSGVGARGGGAYGIRKFCRQQSLISERVSMKSELFWYPHTPRKARLMARLIRLFGMHDWRRRFGLRAS